METKQKFDPQKITKHIRLVGLHQKIGENPSGLHISIEEGGTLTDLKGKCLYSESVSTESFLETLQTFLEMTHSIPRVIKILTERLRGY
jgi:hypothetical protein